MTLKEKLLNRLQTKTSWGRNELKDILNEVFDSSDYVTKAQLQNLLYEVADAIATNSPDTVRHAAETLD